MTNKPLLTLSNSQKKLVLAAKIVTNQLTEQPLSVPKPEPTEPPPVPVTEPIKPQPQKVLLSKERYHHLLQYLQTNYSTCFPSSRNTPLAIGIHKQLMAIPERPFSRSQLEQMLAIYTRSKAYYQSLIIDAGRFNLDGTLASKIRAEEIAFLAKPKFRQVKT